MQKLNILVVGGGGREHALVWKLAQSPRAGKICCAPGNAGIGELAECVAIAQTDVRALLRFAVDNHIDLTVVGPEDALVAGIVDEFEASGLKIFGPSARAAELEGSKAFSKKLMSKYQIPTAAGEAFTRYEAARDFLSGARYPLVVKADGLAAGKGTFICPSLEQALSDLDKIMVERRFGKAGKRVIIEEFMQGEEASVLAITDGEHLAYLAPAQDHKAVFDGDEGPNTGGMGAYAPAPVMTAEMMQRVHEEIMQPTVQAMALEGRPYRGVLYAGLMITGDDPKVVEYNCRFGDPETQVVLPLLDEDLLELALRVASGEPISAEVAVRNCWALCVVIAAGGYPGKYDSGKEIIGLGKPLGAEVTVFHAGTKRSEDGTVVTSGGRVLGVTACASDFYTAREHAYRAVGKLTFDRAYYRKDIGMKALRHLKSDPQKRN